jgi:transcriptional regulator with XRE-family HTH domain/DNA polymerase III delta prime subunit
MPKPNTLLQEERKKRGWTQEQLAEMIEADPDSVGNWESGRRGTSRYYQKRLVSVFGLPPERLGFPAGSAEVLSLPNTATLSIPVPEEPVPALSISSPSRGENFAQIEHVLRGREGDENRHSMLWQMRITWIEGVLKHSLDPGILITPDLVELPEALENPWHLLVRETDGVARELPKGTSIVQMYDIANEELLILGEPGSGKTTLLLDLARELLVRAEQNASYPIPVILNLTSWTRKRSTLTEWMAEEMYIKYHVPEEVAHTWIADEQVIVLLDGLDEIATEALTSCFKAIREYQDTRPRGLLVICCRRGDYFAQSIRLSLQKAVLIQPLTREQIYGYLTTTDGQLETVRQALQDDPELEAICTTPLLLNIATRAYQVKAAAILTSGESLEKHRQQVFKAYVERMLSRRGIEPHYNQQQTIRWLAWLAEQMQKRSQTEFYLERIQPAWLSNERMQHHLRNTTIRIVYGIESLLFAGLFALLPGGIFRTFIDSGANYIDQSRNNPSSKALGWIAPGLGGGNASLGLILALVTILVSFMINSQTLNLSAQKVWRSLIKAVRSGTIGGGILGIIAVAIFLPKLGIANSLARGADVGLLGGLLIGFQSGLIAWLHKKNTSEKSREKHLKQHLFAFRRPVRFLDLVGDFVVFSCCAGFGYGGIYTLLIREITPDVVTYSLLTALFF